MPFEVTILGSSSALPTTERYPTAQVVNLLGRYFLVDCAEGTQIQLRRMKLNMGKIKHIFISHLHGDHFFGLPGLISSLSLLGIKNDLYIYSHEKLQELIKPIIRHIQHGLDFKIYFYNLNFNKPEIIYSDKKTEVLSFPLKHSIPVCGFLFKEKKQPANIKKELIKKYNIPIKQIPLIKNGADFITNDKILIPHSDLTIPPAKTRSYAFCTDTLFDESITKIIMDTDLLYHEATFMNDMAEWAKNTFHSTALQAATIAKKAKVKKLIIGHFSARYKNIDPIVEEARSIFKESFAAEDGETHKIKKTD